MAGTSTRSRARLSARPTPVDCTLQLSFDDIAPSIEGAGSGTGQEVLDSRPVSRIEQLIEAHVANIGDPNAFATAIFRLLLDQDPPVAIVPTDRASETSRDGSDACGGRAGPARGR